jgi:putative ABC transport system ATP-binding protein
MSAYENVDFFLRINGYNHKLRDQRIIECMKFVGLEKRMHHRPSQMSGGEQQRVAIARSIAHNPVLILADEPTAELDTATGLKVVGLFKEMIENEGATVIMCTHDRSLMEYANHIFEMEDGVIIDVK